MYFGYCNSSRIINVVIKTDNRIITFFTIQIDDNSCNIRGYVYYSDNTTVVKNSTFSIVVYYVDRLS